MAGVRGLPGPAPARPRCLPRRFQLACRGAQKGWRPRTPTSGFSPTSIPAPPIPSPLEQLLVTAYFTMPNTPLQLEAKEVAIERVAAVMTGYYSYGPAFIQDTVRRFAGTPHRDNAEWAADLGKSKRAVRDCRQGVIRRLHKILDSAMDKLDAALEERGYVAV